jgi:P pilus assembly chaperone PapD
MSIMQCLIRPRGGSGSPPEPPDPTFTFTLSGQQGLTTDGNSPFNTTNAIKIDSNGNMYEGDSLDGAAITYTQIDTATDWVRPTDNPTIYYARYSNVSGTFTNTPGTVNTAIPITSDLVWSLNRTSSGGEQVDFTLEILDTDQTTVLATGTYRVRCFNTL